MARASSVIAVKIVGDASSLVKASSKAQGSTAGLLKGVGGALAIIGGTKAIFDFVDSSIEQADKLGDATARLDAQLPPDLAKKVEDVAGAFHRVGLSKADVLEASANVIDLGKALRISTPFLAAAAPKVAEFAAAISQLGGTASGVTDPNDIANLIVKAAGGAAKAAKDLGVTLADPKTTDPAVQLALIMDQLAGKVSKVTEGEGDLEQKQKEINAKFRDFQAAAGGVLSEVAVGIIDFINDEAEALPGAIQGWTLLAQKLNDLVVPDTFKVITDFLAKVNADIPRTIQGFVDLGGGIVQFARNVLGPLGNVLDVLVRIQDAINRADPFQHGGDRFVVSPGRTPRSPVTDSAVNDAQRRFNERNGGP